MKTEIKNRFEAFERVLACVSGNASRIPGARLPILLTELRVVVERLRLSAGSQEAGHREFRAAAAGRLHFANLLREEMRFIAFMAKVLDRDLHPGLRYQLRLPRSQSYLALIVTATAFIERLTPIKAAFIERGFPPDFLERIAALIEQIKDADAAKNSALMQRSEGTVTLMRTSSRGLALVSEMHAIITRCFRHNAALLAEWEVTRHVRRPNKPRPIQTTTPPTQENAATSAEPIPSETSVPPAPTPPLGSVNPLQSATTPAN
jgi:hypothetical protein